MATILEYGNHSVVRCKNPDALREANLKFCNEFDGIEAERGKRRIAIEVLGRQLLGENYEGTKTSEAV